MKSSQVVVQVAYSPPPFGEYTGNLTLTLTPAAEYNPHFSYEGDVSLTLTPAADTGTGTSYFGDLLLTLTPAAEVVVSFVYEGDLSFSLTPEAECVGDRWYEGSLTLHLEPASRYATLIPGFDHWYGYGLVDLTFLDGNPPYFCVDPELTLSLTSEADHSTYSEVGEGGVSLSGLGVFAFEDPEEEAIFTAVGSGGVELAGRGTATFIHTPPIFTLVGSNGFTLSGIGTTASIDPEVSIYSIVGTGGFKLSGDGVFTFSVPDVIFSLVGTGGLALNGAGSIAWIDPSYFHVIGSGGVVLSGEGTDEDFYYLTWVFSGADYKPSVYGGYNFNSYCTFNGKTYGASEDGVFELTGTTDEGKDVHTGLVLGPHNLGVNNRKRLRSIFLGNKNRATRVKVDLDETSKVYPVTRGKVKVTRDLIGEDITLRIADFEEISVVEITPVVIGRRG